MFLSVKYLTVNTLLLLLNITTVISTTNYNYHYFYNSEESSSLVFSNEAVPTQAAGPGWIDNPRDVKATVGSYVFFTCRNSLPHNQTVWLLEGREDIFYTKYSSIVYLKNKGRTLRFGPINKEHDRISINCEIWTKYGAVPSPLGMIYVITTPRYNPSSKTVFIGQPAYYDFGYSGSNPDYFRWYKNGKRYYGDFNRVTLDYNGITFTKVLQHDSGIYEVQSNNKAGSGKGSGYLRVVYWWQNGTSDYEHAAMENPEIPIKVALALAVSENKTKISGYAKYHKKLQVSAADSTVYAMKVLRKLNSKATEEAKRQGQSREEIEGILYNMVKIIGHPLKYLNESDMDLLINMTNCEPLSAKYNCLDYRVLKYRTINGTCNNLFFPLNGAANMPFARLLPADYEDDISQPYGFQQAQTNREFDGPWPSPRYVSWKVVKDMEHSSEKMSHMFMSWGQFLDHDIDLAPVFDDENGEELECDCNYTRRCLPIPVKSNDPVFGDRSVHRGQCLPLTRSIPACQNYGGLLDLARNQINQLTSYIDASQVYGSDDVHASNLRLHSAGLLKTGGTVSGKDNLPFQEKMAPRGNIPLFDAGDTRSNEQVGLTVMHTIWLREHNRIARMLAKMNPCWGDEKIYQETRKILGAMMQVITYKEFLPLLFGQYYEEYVPPYFGYNPFIDVTIPNSFATAALRFGHSLIRPVLMRLNENWEPVDEGPLPLERAFFNPVEYFKSNGTDPLLRGLLVAHSRDIDIFINNILTTKLFTESPERIGMDLASLNIQRGRDHGIPSYRKWQRLCENVYPKRNASFHFRSVERALRDVYGTEGFNEGMDLWVGGLAERKLPGAQVGPTFACILGLTFTRIRDGDRFWYESPYNFRYSQLREIRKVTLAKVICNNAENITSIQPEAFRSDQKRLSCSQLADINLRYWSDSHCRNYHLKSP